MRGTNMKQIHPYIKLTANQLKMIINLIRCTI